MPYPSPIYEKTDPHPTRDFAPITPATMEHLFNWARWASVEAGSPVYLVGSVLYKTRPRDIDVAIIWPLDRFEHLFGPVPQDESEWTAFWTQDGLRHALGAFHVSASSGVGHIPRIDVKLCPDVWFLDKPKVLIGHPTNHVTVTKGYRGEPFYIPKIAQYKVDDTGLLTDELDRVLFDPAWLKEA